MEILDCTVKLIWAYLTPFTLGKKKVSNIHHITRFKATFDCTYCKFYSLFGNLFQLSMKSCLQWISQHIHKIIMNSHNRTAQNGLLLLVPVKRTKIHKAHLKCNLYNRQGPTDANSTVCNLNIALLELDKNHTRTVC